MTIGRIPSIDGGIQPTIIDAKGDLLTATAADTPARLAVGANDTVLTADSSTATGLKWAAISASPASAVATVTTSEATTSDTYTDLTTSGPAVTITTGTKVLVIVTSRLQGDVSGTQQYVDFAISGATTRSASDTTALFHRRGTGDNFLRMSSATRLTVTAGSNTFTAKYKTSTGGTATFENRQIFVMDLGS